MLQLQLALHLRCTDAVLCLWPLHCCLQVGPPPGGPEYVLLYMPVVFFTGKGIPGEVDEQLDTAEGLVSAGMRALAKGKGAAQMAGTRVFGKLLAEFGGDFKQEPLQPSRGSRHSAWGFELQLVTLCACCACSC